MPTSTPSSVSVPPNPRLRIVGASLFALFAAAFVVATGVHLTHGGGDPLHADSNVVLYAFSPVPLLVLGAAACLWVTPRTYQSWMVGLLVLFLGWAVASTAAVVRVDTNETFVVYLHMLFAGMGATTIFLVRGVARQRGLRF